ncbi:heparan-alpha-glucosaminide N-acetyltransferase domain-containing protein [Actinotalea sp. K2]|uniref:heparan-alpha-glucosaminide N-acetyltransferase domain-containing protein n=1 Tax=Actinotalea sp. K2 TaxID=2939438 RepID=UPI0020174909|nr:heparan-alpha-glucosaminide N-acetyltransferase domain-containing protein [Actinotalea sp. K2]MCL3860519.1 heparan-alpha-glucosaminide N-acetyltransferase domain-containing protein [Actinotalea sp. K2]
MERVVGIDVARGLAVLGMFAAHLGASDEEFWTRTGWLQVADGRSAATFALLAGVSAALLSGGRTPVDGAALRQARVRIVARAVALWPLGALLIALDTPVVVILPAYAVMFAVTAGLLRLPPRTLLLIAGVVVVVGPPVVRLAQVALGDPREAGQHVDVLVGDYYPAAVWIAYLLVGLAVGRTDLRSPEVGRRLAGAGALCVVLGYGTAAVARRVLPPGSAARDLLTSEPHSSTGPEVVGNIGVALLVLATCLAVTARAPRLLAPLAATGALALTAYCSHLVAIAIIGEDAVWDPSNLRLATFVLVTLAAATAWRLTLGRGPLERALHAGSGALAHALVPTEPEPSDARR